MYGKNTRRIPFSLCLRKKPTNFSSQQTVCEPFPDSAAQVPSPVHTYAHLIRAPFGALVYMRLYMTTPHQLMLVQGDQKELLTKILKFY